MKLLPYLRSTTHQQPFLPVLLIIFLLSCELSAQNKIGNNITYSGFGEFYYGYDFSNPENHERPNFIYNHKRHNEINANLILGKAAYKTENTRANLGLMVGNYAEYNLSNEPNWAQFIYEANLGVKLSSSQNLWLDVGIMPSHIGFESAISGDCYTLTRSILAENSPYYETGAKLGFTNKRENLAIAIFALNGWQKIRKIDGNQKPSFGIQINYKPKENMVINYSNFLGSDQPDSLRTFRVFHNFYWQYETRSKFDFIVGFDLGTEKKATAQYATWFSPVGIVRYRVNKRVKLAARGEFYSDEDQVIIATNTADGSQVLGLSTNFDYAISDAVQFRIEGKMFRAREPIFIENQRENYLITTNMTIRF